MAAMRRLKEAAAEWDFASYLHSDGTYEDSIGFDTATGRWKFVAIILSLGGGATEINNGLNTYLK